MSGTNTGCSRIFFTMHCNVFHKNRVLIINVVLWLAIVWPVLAQAQQGRPGSAPSGNTEKVELLSPPPDSLVVLNNPDGVVRRLVNHVKLRHKGVLMFCDLAIQNVTTNVIEAYGNVRIVQGDTISIKGDTMFYYGNTRQANLRGRITMRDRKMTLTTTKLDYDMVNGIAHYPVKGRIVDRENVLTSNEGFYDTRIKQFRFYKNVKLVGPKGTLSNDSLVYNSLSRIATFRGPTKIVNKDGTIFAKEGEYNTATRVSNFQKRTTVEMPKYTLTGDTLFYDNTTELGIAKGNVVLVSKEDKTVITGDHGRYNGKAGVSRVTGHAVVRSVVSQDTLFMRADTLFAFDAPAVTKSDSARLNDGTGKDEPKKPKKLIGQKNVIVYKSDLQSRCDSLVYDVADSTIYFYKKPIVWSQNYQMEADSMTAKMKNNRIDRMLLRTRSFVIAQDTLKNFNQVKGRSITAYFRSVTDTVSTEPPASQTVAKGNAKVKPEKPGSTTTVNRTVLDRVIVEGNGQSIYFAVDEKNKLVGLNHVECSRMNLEFDEKSKVQKIRFYGQPDAQFVPPVEMNEDKKVLEGFLWRKEDRPDKTTVLTHQITVQPRKPAINKKSGPLTKPSALNSVLTKKKQ